MSIVAIPSRPGESVDRRILADVVLIERLFKVKVNDGYATTGHAAGGEHPLGLAIDVEPDRARGGTWDDVDRLAKWAEPSQNKPRAPFRWVGYTGDPGHGRDHHLHLSWLHPGSRVVTLTGDQRAELARAAKGGDDGFLSDVFGTAKDAAKFIPGAQPLGFADEILGAGKDVAGAGLNAAEEAAAAGVRAVLGPIWDAIKGSALTVLVYAVLILGGAALALGGLARATGVNPTSVLPIGRAMKGARA